MSVGGSAHAGRVGHRANARQVTATVENARDYSVLGVQQDPTASFEDVPFGYTGQEEDADLGLVNMKGRIYDPVLGEFLTPDPIMTHPMGHGLNAFNYVLNRPLNMIDPSGFTDVDPGFIIFMPEGGAQEIEFSADVLRAHVPGAQAAPAQSQAVSNVAPTAATDFTVTASPAQALNVGASVANTAVNLAIHSNTPVKRQGAVPSRAQSASSSGVPSAGRTSGDPVRPTTVDPGVTAVQKSCNPDVGCPVPGAADAADAHAPQPEVAPDLAKVAPLVRDTHEMWDEAAGVVATLMPGMGEGEAAVLLFRAAARKWFAGAAARAASAIPKWVKNAGSLVNHARNLEKARVPITKEAADELVHAARQYGVKITPDVPHPGTPWDIPHIHLGEARVHVPVPEGYTLPP